jgi:hypothetical protein
VAQRFLFSVNRHDKPAPEIKKSFFLLIAEIQQQSWKLKPREVA